jgi:hypothetical protein
MPGVKPKEEGVERLELSGYAYTDRVATAVPIAEFRDRLRQSDYFTDATKLAALPDPALDAVTRAYTIIAVLEKPLQP